MTGIEPAALALAGGITALVMTALMFMFLAHAGRPGDGEPVRYSDDVTIAGDGD